MTGMLAGVLSALALVWRGHCDCGHAAAAINAPSHWLWGESALRRDAPSLRHTLCGTLIHQLSSLFWAAWHRALGSPSRPLADAVAVTALAAWIDLQVAPPRLRPGFERRLSARSLAWVHVAFGTGLWLGAHTRRRRRR